LVWFQEEIFFFIIGFVVFICYPVKGKDTLKTVLFIKYITMPQLVPFYFVNQVVFNFLFLVLIIYVFSKYILPRFVRLFKTRLHINNY